MNSYSFLYPCKDLRDIEEIRKSESFQLSQMNSYSFLYPCKELRDIEEIGKSESFQLSQVNSYSFLYPCKDLRDIEEIRKSKSFQLSQMNSYSFLYPCKELRDIEEIGKSESFQLSQVNSYSFLYPCKDLRDIEEIRKSKSFQLSQMNSYSLFSSILARRISYIEISRFTRKFENRNLSNYPRWTRTLYFPLSLQGEYLRDIEISRHRDLDGNSRLKESGNGLSKLFPGGRFSSSLWRRSSRSLARSQYSARARNLYRTISMI